MVKEKKYGVLSLSCDLFKQLLDECFEVPKDLEILGAEYDGFRRTLRIATMSFNPNFYKMAEGGTIPVVDLKPKLKKE